jgi:hypothetical protein
MLLRNPMRLAGLAALVLLVAGPARATSLALTSLDTPVGVGDPVSVAIAISGLGNPTPKLGAYDLAISFDPSILTFGSVSFGSFLLPSFQDDFLVNGGTAVHVEETSFASDLSGEPTAFTLATIHFTAAHTGVSVLSFFSVQVFDQSGDAFVSSPNTGISITVVPEPATALLLLVGLGALRARPRPRAA